MTDGSDEQSLNFLYPLTTLVLGLGPVQAFTLIKMTSRVADLFFDVVVRQWCSNCCSTLPPWRLVVLQP